MNVTVCAHAGVVEIADLGVILSIQRHFQMSAFKVGGITVLTPVQVEVRNTHRRGEFIFNEIRQLQYRHVGRLVAGFPFRVDLPVDRQLRAGSDLIGVAVTHRDVGLAVMMPVEHIHH